MNSPKTRSKKATPAKPADFFISYNHRDLATAEVLGGWLKSAGFSTYMQSRDFHTASNFLERMNEGIKCDRLLSVYTINYSNSPECMEELWAMRRRDPSGKDGRVVICKLDATDPPPLLGARVYIDLVGKTGEAVQTGFLKAVATLPKLSIRRVRSPAPAGTALPASILPPPAPNEKSFNVTQQGDGNIAAGGNVEMHFHDHATPRRIARARPPKDVVTEDQAVRIKLLMDELIGLDAKTFGVGLSEASIRSKWWGALYKHVPATSYKNFSQRKYQKALKWGQQHKARMLTELRGEDSDAWRKNAYGRIKGYMRDSGVEKLVFYSDISRRAHIEPPFTSLTDLTDEELNRVYGAVVRDSRKAE